MAGYTYDAGMLIAAESDDRRAWVLHRRAVAAGVSITVPAGVLGQVWRGGPQHSLSRFLSGTAIESLDERVARSSGAACALARTADVVDASVAVGALVRDDIIVTSDVADLEALSQAIGRRGPIRRI